MYTSQVLLIARHHDKGLHDKVFTHATTDRCMQTNKRTLHAHAGQMCCVYSTYISSSYLFSVALRKQQHLWGRASRGQLKMMD
jgi:hypothetical protein